MKRKTFILNFEVVTLLFVLLATTKSFSLNYTISFTGSGASSTVESVIVQNLTKGTTVSVPIGNNLNLTDVVTAVQRVSVNEETIHVYPYSMEGKFTVSFFAKQAGVTQINAFSKRQKNNWNKFKFTDRQQYI